MQGKRQYAWSAEHKAIMSRHMLAVHAQRKVERLATSWNQRLEAEDGDPSDPELGLGYLDRGETPRTFAQSLARTRDPRRRVVRDSNWRLRP